MDEKKEKKSEEKESETSEKDEKTEKEKQENTGDLVANANAAAERLEKANEKQGELLKQQEELMARQTLHGKAEAGQGNIKEEPESDIDFANNLTKREDNILFPKGE